jgi:hypothetical protein
VVEKPLIIISFLLIFYDICVFFKEKNHFLNHSCGFLDTIFSFFKRLFNLSYVLNNNYHLSDFTNNKTYD